MAKKQPKQNRLPRTFHTSFKPERHYITAMLRYAAGGNAGTYQEIRDATGIPTGEASGKVQAILDYCRGMGLITLADIKRKASKLPELTPFGRIVLLEDPHLKEPVTQWIAHFNLCSPIFGADVWFHAFFSGAQILGMRFPRAKLEEHLSLIYGIQRGNLIGPLVGMYQDVAAFAACGALSEEGSVITRVPAPIGSEFGYSYGAWMLQLMADHFPKEKQITVTDLDARAGWRTIPGWDIPSVQRILQLVEIKGLIEVDRHMDPWILRGKSTLNEAWGRIYNDLI